MPCLCARLVCLVSVHNMASDRHHRTASSIPALRLSSLPRRVAKASPRSPGAPPKRQPRPRPQPARVL
eukprot:366086-Chlamydomonas_euryale.AAC.7